MNTYTEPQKIDLVSQGMQRIEDALRDAVECIEDAGELQLINPTNHTQGE